MINKTIVPLYEYISPHVCVLEAECQRSEWLPAQNVQSSLPPAQFHILCILCGAFPDHRKPNTHAGEHAHLLTTTSSDIISLPHTHTLIPLIIPPDICHYIIIISKQWVSGIISICPFFPFLNTGPPETLCGLWPRILHATLFFLNRKSNRRHLYHTVHSVPSPTTKRRKCALHNNQTKLI